MDLLHLLDRSAATEAFKADVRAFLAHQPAPRVATARLAPRVKVARVLTQLLDSEPGLAVDRVRVDGVSGCSDFRGTLTVEAEGATRTFVFAWCCQWRADREGWRDAFGFSDQIRAAREFDWRCFERWREVSAEGALQG
jgi:hypothetical protein